LLPAPLVLSGVLPRNGATEITVDLVLQEYGDRLALVIDDGPRRSSLGNTIIQVSGQSWRILKEGEVTAAEVARKTVCVILFVCTGNTCRSPMADALCQKLLAEKLHCSP